ncbi:MAG: 30S ribosomal protein S30e [Candidatus Bathyarchaeota archaeon]|nr:MAG: 30S ribosomal protein S30e [Candidatus Bathyarchaeota archaeon]
MPTHGSLTKAGKVRNQTPKIPPTRKKNTSPRRRNLRNYQKMITNQRAFDKGRRRRRRRR